MKGLLPLSPFLALASFFLLVHTTSSLALAQSVCPPSEDVLAPCTCRDDTIKVINCSHILDPTFNLTDVLDRASELISDEVIFDRLVILNTSLTELEDGAVKTLKFAEIFVSRNPNLEYVSPAAFLASTNFTTELTLSWNNIRNEGARERDIFHVINAFEKLDTAWLQGNRLTSIPSNALQNLPLLQRLRMNNNSISHIGSRAFTPGAPNLRDLTLRQNNIPPEGLLEDVFEGLSPAAEVDIWDNGMTYLEQRSYQPLLDVAKRVFVGALDCGLVICQSAKSMDCDQRADWLCDSEDRWEYRDKLTGFECKRESGFQGVWDYCNKRNETGSNPQ